MGRAARELDNLRTAVRPLRRLYADPSAAAFGPVTLRDSGILAFFVYLYGFCGKLRDNRSHLRVSQ